jgi:hypothetical protein
VPKAGDKQGDKQGSLCSPGQTKKAANPYGLRPSEKPMVGFEPTTPALRTYCADRGNGPVTRETRVSSAHGIAARPVLQGSAKNIAELQGFTKRVGSRG